MPRSIPGPRPRPRRSRSRSRSATPRVVSRATCACRSGTRSTTCGRQRTPRTGRRAAGSSSRGSSRRARTTSGSWPRMRSATRHRSAAARSPSSRHPRPSRPRSRRPSRRRSPPRRRPPSPRPKTVVATPHAQARGAVGTGDAAAQAQAHAHRDAGTHAHAHNRDGRADSRRRPTTRSPPGCCPGRPAPARAAPAPMAAVAGWRRAAGERQLGRRGAARPGGTSLFATLTRALPATVVATGGVTMAMAFLVFGKKRRDREPTGPDDELAANAARGAGLQLRMRRYAKVVVPNAAAVATAVQAAVSGARRGRHLRHRRPPASLAAPVPHRGTQGRPAPPQRLHDHAPDVRPPRRGQHARRPRAAPHPLPPGPACSTARRVPGTEIGSLAQGDEVLLLERSGTYWRVLCPDGLEGWLHSMTLGDIVTSPSTPDP